MISNPVAARPTAVVVIGVIWLGLAFLLLMSGAMGLTMWHLGGFKEEFATPPQSDDPMFQVAEVMFRHYGTLALVQVLVAIFIAVSAVEFLRLRAWARTCLEVVSWLGITLFLAFLVVWLIAWISLFSDTVNDPEFHSGFFTLFGVLAALMSVIMYVAPLAAIIWFLRRPSLRSAFHAGNEVTGA